MIRYELKKMFGTFGGKLALVLYIAIVALSCWLATTGVLNIGTEWVNEQGEHENGLSAIHKMQESTLPPKDDPIRRRKTLSLTGGNRDSSRFGILSTAPTLPASVPMTITE